MTEKQKKALAKKIGKRIASKIQELGYRSIDEFCKEHDLWKSTIYKMIRGERFPTVPSLIELCKIFNCTIDDIVT